MNTLEEARKRQAQLRRSAEARIAECRAQLSGELPATRPEEELRRRIEVRREFLDGVERGDWPGIRTRHREALQSASKEDAEPPETAGRARPGATPRPKAPKPRPEPSRRPERPESETDRAVRLIREAGEPQERAPADPDVERAAEFILQAGQNEDEVDNAVELIKSAGRS